MEAPRFITRRDCWPAAPVPPPSLSELSGSTIVSLDCFPYRMSRDVPADLLLKNETVLQMGSVTLSFTSVLPWVAPVRGLCQHD